MALGTDEPLRTGHLQSPIPIPNPGQSVSAACQPEAAALGSIRLTGCPQGLRGCLADPSNLIRIMPAEGLR